MCVYLGSIHYDMAHAHIMYNSLRFAFRFNHAVAQGTRHIVDVNPTICMFYTEFPRSIMSSSRDTPLGFIAFTHTTVFFVCFHELVLFLVE